MRQRILASALTLTLVLAAPQGIASAQTKETLIGTWRLLKISLLNDKGVAKDEVDLTGFLTYTRDGRMSSIITEGVRKPLTGSRYTAPANERAEAFASSLAYAGTFDLKGDKVIHHVEASTYPNFVNTDLVRTITKFDGNRITLRVTNPLIARDGMQYAYEDLLWERVK